MGDSAVTAGGSLNAGGVRGAYYGRFRSFLRSQEILVCAKLASEQELITIILSIKTTVLCHEQTS